MAYYESDEGVQQIHDEMYASQAEKERKSSGLGGVDQNTKLWFGIYLAGIFVFWILKKVTGRTALILAGAGVAVYFMLVQTPRIRELTWIECMIRIYDALDFLQKHPIGPIGSQIPKGEIKVTPIGRKQWFEGKGFKRSFGVDIYDKELGLWDMYFVECDIFTGDIISFKRAPQGVSGDETKDIKFIATPDLLSMRRRNEFMGVKQGGGANRRF